MNNAIKGIINILLFGLMGFAVIAIVKIIFCIHQDHQPKEIYLNECNSIDILSDSVRVEWNSNMRNCKDTVVLTDCYGNLIYLYYDSLYIKDVHIQRR